MELHARLYDLSQGQWNHPNLRQLLEERLCQEARVHDIQLEHEFPEIGRKTLRLLSAV